MKLPGFLKREERAHPATTPHSRFNKVCSLEDWKDSARRAAIRAVSSDLARVFPDYPDTREHRKDWEMAQLVTSLDAFGVLRPEASVISVAAGSERTLFHLTNHVRWVFATDIYGSGDFAAVEATSRMLLHPEEFSPIPFNRNHLVVQRMSALELLHDDNTFDAAYSLSSIEHFGGVDGAVGSLREMCRVVKPGGIVMAATECIVNGAERLDMDGLTLFTPEDISHMSAAIPAMTLVEPMDFAIAPETLSHVISLEDAVRDGREGKSTYPHVVLELGKVQFTSVSLLWRKHCPSPTDETPQRK